MLWKFSIVLRKTMLHIWCKLLFVYWSVYDRKKMETNAMNMWSEIMICIKLQLVRKAFYEDAVWIKFKCNDSS